jgi:hypothetical protein
MPAKSCCWKLCEGPRLQDCTRDAGRQRWLWGITWQRSAGLSHMQPLHSILASYSDKRWGLQYKIDRLQDKLVFQSQSASRVPAQLSPKPTHRRLFREQTTSTPNVPHQLHPCHPGCLLAVGNSQDSLLVVSPGHCTPLHCTPFQAEGCQNVQRVGT